MKVLSRDFTRKEKALLLFLSLLMVGLAYYRFVDMNVRETIEKANAEAANLQIELQTLQARVTRLRNLQAQLDSMEELGELSYMPSYNSVKEEVAFLNDVLASTERYNISFADVTRTGAQIRRSFTLQYTTLDYGEAEQIIKELCDYKNRCLVGDIRCSINDKGEVTMNTAATFYETMIGGTADAGLPEDSAVVNT
jgi:hypothetical protein